MPRGSVAVRVWLLRVSDPAVPRRFLILVLISRVMSPPILVTTKPAPGTQGEEAPLITQSQLAALFHVPVEVFQFALLCAAAEDARRRRIKRLRPGGRRISGHRLRCTLETALFTLLIFGSPPA
jgi:hypothetical protein